MARRVQREIPGAAKRVAENVRQALEHLFGECLNASSIGPSTDSVAAIACAVQAMAESDDVEGLHQMAVASRAYLRKKGLPTIAPEPHEVIRGMVRDAEAALAKPENADMTTRILGGWMTHWGLRAFGPPDAYEAAKATDDIADRHEDWSWAPQHVFRRVKPLVTKALQAGVDAEGLVVATLVGYGLGRKRARDLVKSAFRNEARSPKTRRG